ncbi:MAG: hypothetical protein ACHQZS_11840 [Candidatus Binatales bacterium]
MGSGNPQNLINMIVGTGQSLATGYAATPVVSGSPVSGYAARAMMFALSGASGTNVRAGILTLATPVVLNPAWLTGFTGIYEAADSEPMGETKGSGFLNAVNDKLVYQMLFAEFGLSATAYVGIKKGTQPYANILIAVQKAIALAAALSSPRTLLVRAATLTHGEQDVSVGTTQAQYEADILQLQQNLTADLQALTGQAQLVAVFLDQVASWTAYSVATSGIPLAQLAAALDNPDRVFLVCPKYFLTYYSGDGIHLTAHSEEILGEYYARAYIQAIVKGIPWKPVCPTSIVLTNSTTITATFNVPVLPLVIDTSLVSDPGGKGFEYTDNSSPPSISSVAVANGNQVVLTMSGAITATAGNRTLCYAYTGTSGAHAGPTTGARGCLRDSDPALSRLGDSTPLYNWCVTFSENF